MENKFNLSEKIKGFGIRWIYKEDAKEFIKRSRQNKNELYKRIKQDGFISKFDWDIFMIKEDKLAGDELI